MIPQEEIGAYLLMGELALGAIWYRLPAACPQRSPPPVTGAA